jgi:hypothetical protein
LRVPRDETVVNFVMAKAMELELPITEENLEVTGRAATLRVNVTYAVDIEVPFISDTGYRKIFENAVAFGNLAQAPAP